MNAESTPAQAPQAKEEWTAPSLEIAPIATITEFLDYPGNDGSGSMSANPS